MSTHTPETPDRPDRPDRPNRPERPDRPEPGETTEMTDRPVTEHLPEHPTGHTSAQRTQTMATSEPPLAPPVVRGPYLAPVILGLVCLLVAAAAFGQEIADWTIDWGNVGPLGIVAAGLVLVLLGGLGLLSSRRRRR